MSTGRRDSRRRLVAAGAFAACALALLLWMLRSERSATPVAPQGLEPSERALTPDLAVRTPVSAEPAPSVPTERALPSGATLADASPEPIAAVSHSSGPTRTIKGQVLSKATLRGIPGAWLGFEHSHAPEWSTTTDENGCFELPIDDRPQFSILCIAPGYAYESFPWLSPFRFGWSSCGERIELMPAGEVSGSVLDENGQPVTEGEVWNFGENPHRFVGEPRESGDRLSDIRHRKGVDHVCAYVERAALDSEGRFDLHHVVFGEPTYLIVESPAAIREFQPPLVLEEGQHPTIEIRVKAPPRIRGRILLPEPWTGAVVHRFAGFLDERASAARHHDNWTWVDLDAEGNFASGPLWPADVWRVQFEIRYVTPDTGQWLGTLYFETQTALQDKETVELVVDRPLWQR